ncbi:hypothetical protein ACVBEH_17350, partial [Roseateles sp. GG27B]
MKYGRLCVAVRAVGSAALLAALLLGCAPSLPGDAAAIESVGMRALQTRDSEALSQLEAWSRQGSAVAQRELALALLPDTEQQPQARLWLARAATGG